MIELYLDSLVEYAVRTGLAQEADCRVLTNRLLDILRLDDYTPTNAPLIDDLEQILAGILDYACGRGLCEDNVTARDLYDTRLMGALTPLPHEVIAEFDRRYAVSPRDATDWYYRFSGDTDYIRRYRVARDIRWVYPSEYGDMDITINLSKPEKDPRAIAAAKNAPQSGYPKCQLCPENEGYAGRMNHPARENHRIIPLSICGESWFLQYSPYVYYNEHCIVFNSSHTPMAINRAAFEKLLEFVTVFPHYFVGSNADLPIVGGSILSHEHFQGGHYCFAMEKAPVEQRVVFRGFEDIEAGIVKWLMSVLRLNGDDPKRLAGLAEKILLCWRGYSDEHAGILAETDGEPHNTITPIARRRDGKFELDLVLRCNITTAEHPLGVFHPHADKHHIKKENIGLIEVLGLAILPSRLKQELHGLAQALTEGRDISADPVLCKHAGWCRRLQQKYSFTQDNVMDILKAETGRVFTGVLEDAGVYKCTAEGRAAFLKFVERVNQ